jgi:hypothetical protein
MDPAWRPFCSERCRLADLGRWLSEDYRVSRDHDEDTPSENGPDRPRTGPSGHDEAMVRDDEND